MKHMAVILLCGAAFAAQATTVDYTVALDPNGFNVYEVTKDTLKKVTGSPFGSTLVNYVATDGAYIYAVTRVPWKPPAPTWDSDTEVVTYQMVNGKPKQVAVLKDNEYSTGACGSCTDYATETVATPQHLFVKMVGVSDGSGVWTQVHVYHKHSGGLLSVMCDIQFDLNPLDTRQSPVTTIRVDSNEFYAYLTYIDQDTQQPKTDTYDISTSPCKYIGTVGAGGNPVTF